jgi:crotonobetainyl-CoA:carnitine CoA-transferase CaiB-like acyl-CoA transferase
MNNIDSVVGKLSIKYPHLIILVAYRFNPSVSKHETNRQSHDVNIQSLAGILSLFGQTDNPTDNSPQYPSAIATLVGANTGAIQFMKTIY